MYVARLHLENVKGFPALKFDFARPDGSFAGWTVFVGGNSSGKSTLLKSIALALMGPEAGSRLMGTTSGWIAHKANRASAIVSLDWDRNHDNFTKMGKLPGRTFEAGVRWIIEVKDDTTPSFRAVDRRNAKGGRVQTAERGPWSSNSSGWYAAGYGPMRRLTGSSSESMRYTVTKEVESRFVTLFREDAALSESEEWLRRMHARSLENKRQDIESVLTGVRELLGDGLLPHGMKISRITVDQVFVADGRKVELPMRDISDGCRSIYATVLDIVHGMYEVFGADDLFSRADDGTLVVNRPGVVIIDEVEAHLHPAWQRDIPSWLTKHFPQIQFLVASHSPLIAQAADPNGLFLLPLQNDSYSAPRPATDVEYEKIRWGSAHKTVLGVAFGLSTTRTKWAAQQLDRWKTLSAKHEAGVLSGKENHEYRDLRKQLKLALDGAPTMDAL